MTTRTQLNDALKDAMRSGNDLRKNTIRMVVAAIKMAEIEKHTAPDEAMILAILQKEVKSRHESIADAQRASRLDLIATAEQEIAILQEFLPNALTPEQLEALAKEVIKEVGATSPREMGQVMKALMPRLQGQATGDQASQAVRKLLG